MIERVEEKTDDCENGRKEIDGVWREGQVEEAVDRPVYVQQH